MVPPPLETGTWNDTGVARTDEVGLVERRRLDLQARRSSGRSRIGRDRRACRCGRSQPARAPRSAVRRTSRAPSPASTRDAASAPGGRRPARRCSAVRRTTGPRRSGRRRAAELESPEARPQACQSRNDARARPGSSAPTRAIRTSGAAIAARGRAPPRRPEPSVHTTSPTSRATRRPGRGNGNSVETSASGSAPRTAVGSGRAATSQTSASARSQTAVPASSRACRPGSDTGSNGSTTVANRPPP